MNATEIASDRRMKWEYHLYLNRYTQINTKILTDDEESALYAQFKKDWTTKINQQNQV